MQSPMPGTMEETNVTQAPTTPHTALLSVQSSQPRPAKSLCSVLYTTALPSKNDALAARIRSKQYVLWRLQLRFPYEGPAGCYMTVQWKQVSPHARELPVAAGSVAR